MLANGFKRRNKMEESGYVVWIAQKIGTSEPAIRLLISLLLGYPVAFFHRRFLFGKSPNLQHLYFTGCGMGFCYFNYGTDLIHSFASIAITYLLLKVLGGSLLSLILVFTYTMLHLFIGYWMTATTTYDIKWTMPQCVLTLRLIGLAFNVYDGQQPRDSLSKENQEVALPIMPSVLEVFAHSYFPGSFMVGPQLPLKRYQDFVTLKLEGRSNPSELPDSVSPGLQRFSLGLLYLSIYQIGSIYVYDDYIMSEEYVTLSLWKQFFVLGLWSRFTLYKYISCWLITEGSCIIMGLTYNGVDENGKTKWDGCSNVKLRIFEMGTRMNHYIESFNINTNQWVAQYIYKRLKFLNNKTLSHVGALLFLAIWHGFHSGYYVTFLFEFLIITCEKDIITILKMQERLLEVLMKPSVYPVIYVFLRIYTFVMMGYAMIPFILLKYDKYMPVMTHFYLIPHIVCISMLALSPFLKSKLRRRDRSDASGSGVTGSSFDQSRRAKDE